MTTGEEQTLLRRSGIPGRRYFIVVFVLCSIMLMVFTAVIYRQSTISAEYNEAVIKSYERLRSATRVLSYAVNLETGQRGYLLTGAEPFLAPYNANLSLIDAEIAHLKEQVEKNDSQAERVATLESEMRRVKAMLREQILTYQIKGPPGITVGKLNQSKQRMDRVRSLLNQIIEDEGDTLSRKQHFAGRQNKNYILTLFMGAALAVGGMVIANLMILRLIARNRRTEEELRHFEESYRIVMQGVRDGIFDYYPDTKIMYFSPSYLGLLGYTSDELPSHIDTFAKLLHPDDFQAVWDLTDRFIRKEENEYSIIFRMKHKNGSWRWILGRAIGIWEGEEIRRIVGSHTDITQQKTYEEELKQVNAELEGFTYIASHDLRAPLVNLKGFAGELEHAYERAKPVLDKIAQKLNAEERAILDESFAKDVPEALGFIRASVEKMDKLTSAILDLSRIGRRHYKQEKVDVDAMIKRCIDTLAFELNEKSAEVTAETLETPLITDAIALEQVVSNILDNAIKYLEPDRKGRIHIGFKRLPGELRFAVADNGRGIAENDRSRVFDIFRRATNSGEVRGLGMGMAYVKATVRKLGGRIWFESDIGKGTTFFFTVPVKT